MRKQTPEGRVLTAGLSPNLSLAFVRPRWAIFISLQPPVQGSRRNPCIFHLTRPVHHAWMGELFSQGLRGDELLLKVIEKRLGALLMCHL